MARIGSVSGRYRSVSGPYTSLYVFFQIFLKNLGPTRAPIGPTFEDRWMDPCRKKKQYRNHCSENKIIQKSLLMQILCPAKTFIFMRAPAECCIEKSARVFPPEKQCRNPFSQKKNNTEIIAHANFHCAQKNFYSHEGGPRRSAAWNPPFGPITSE